MSWYSEYRNEWKKIIETVAAETKKSPQMIEFFDRRKTPMDEKKLGEEELKEVCGGVLADPSHPAIDKRGLETIGPYVSGTCTDKVAPKVGYGWLDSGTPDDR